MVSRRVRARSRGVDIFKSDLIRAIGTHPNVVGYMDRLGVMVAYAMERGQRGRSNRVRRETTHMVVHVGSELRPVLVVKAGLDTGEGRSRPGFFSVFLELGTKNMKRKTFMRGAAKAAMKAEGLQVFKYKAYPKREGSVEWRK